MCCNKMISLNCWTNQFQDSPIVLCSLDSKKIFKKSKEQQFLKAHACDTTYWPAYHFKAVEGRRASPYKNQSDERIPSVSLPDFTKEKLFRAVVYLQKLIRGRASQTMMHSFRKQHFDTIMSLKQTFGVSQETSTQVELERVYKVTAFRKYNLATQVIAMIKGIINQSQGAIISSILDFAHKELSRFEDERTTYKLVTGVHRARWARESEEAGIRQKELRRRQQHEEMTKQVVKAQDVALNEFLHSLMNEAMRQEAEEEAREATEEKADLQEPRYHEEFIEAFDRELLSSRLLFSHLIPEAKRLPIREKVEERQERYRRNAYRMIFGREEKEFPEDETKTERCLRLKRVKRNKEDVKAYEASRTPGLNMNQDEIYEYLKDFLHETSERMDMLSYKEALPHFRVGSAKVFLPSISTIFSDSSGDNCKPEDL